MKLLRRILFLLPLLGCPASTQAAVISLHPGDTMVVDTDWTNQGDIRVYGGVFHAHGCRINQQGNIIVAFGGTFFLDTCSFTETQRYDHEFRWGIVAGLAAELLGGWLGRRHPDHEHLDDGLQSRPLPGAHAGR